MAGTAAGMCNGLLLNPISAVKYKTWGRDVNRGMWNEVCSMFQQGGMRPFVNGLAPTILRDVAFGGVYTFLRLEAQSQGLPLHYQWIGNMVSAAIAAVISGPFNLARNEQYATRSGAKAPTIANVLLALLQEVKQLPTTYDRWHLLQSRLRIGYGTIRVAIGMAFGHYVYDTAMFLYYPSHKTEFHDIEERLQLPPTRQDSFLGVPRRGPETNSIQPINRSMSPKSIR